jgi:integrase
MKKKQDEEKRRQRGTGSIFRKAPCKLWVIQFYKNGKRIREATGSADHDVAKKLLRQRLHEIDKNEYVKRQGRAARVRDLYDALKVDRDINKKGRKRELPGRWRHLEPAFGAMLASEITTDDVLRYIRARQAGGASNATVNRELATLKRMFRFGMQCTPPKIRVVPHIPMLKENNVRTGFVEDADFTRLAFLAEAPTAQPWLRAFLELAFTFGWRRGELLGLRVRQVNLTTRTIRLDVGTTKNKEGREVAMTAKVAELLRVAVRGKKPDDLVLTRRGGEPVTDFRGAWRSLCVQAGLGKFVCLKCKADLPKAAKCKACGSRNRKYSGLIPHDMRRSAAKALRAAGVAESVIMQAGGWKTAAMFRRYAIVSSADQRAAVEMLERARASATAPFSAPLGSGEPAAANGVKPN